MINNLTYKYKFIGLVLIIILLLILSFNRSFIKTYNVWNNNRILSRKLLNIESRRKRIMELEKKLVYLNKTIGTSGMYPDVVQLNILTYATNCNNVRIVDVSKVHRIEESDFYINSYKIILKGNFENLLKCIYLYEKKNNMAKLVSIDFYTHKDYNKNKKELLVKLILQNYEKK